MDEKDELQRFIKKKLNRYGTYRSRWSILHIAVIALPIILSWSAGLTLQLDSLAEWAHTTDIATVLSGLAGLIVALGARLSVERKWRACLTAKRKTEGQLGELIVDGDHIKEIQTKTEEIYKEWAEEFGYTN